METVPVLIVGGGPVGLSAALELARNGVPSLLVERHDSTTWHPKARLLNTRTMEISRGWGSAVHEELKAVNLPPEWRSQIIYARTLAGEELGRMRTGGFSGPDRGVSPEGGVLSSQDIIEPILRRGAEATGLAELRFGHEAGKITAGENAVALAMTERATGRTYEVKSDYLIAADGANSSVRNQFEIEMEGPQRIGHFVNVYFRADIERWVGERPAAIYFIANPSAQGGFQPLDGRGRWLCQIAYDGSQTAFEAYTPEKCIEWIRTAVGAGSCEPEVLSIASWTMNATVARRMAHGRVLLAGDAAHQLPPTGGFGANTGIQDVHNLAWKLALVLSGTAAPALIDTYEVERHPVARFNADRSLENAAMVRRINAAALSGRAEADSPGEAVGASRRYGNFLGMELGFHYDSAAVVPDDTEPPVVEDEVVDYAPSARPGHRAPHVWLERDSSRVSTLDLFGQGFTLLAGPAGHAWIGGAARAGKRVGTEIRAHSVGGSGDYADVNGDWAQKYGVNDDGAVLVRPDGHVAWRARDASAPDPEGRLADALRRVLCR